MPTLVARITGDEVPQFILLNGVFLFIVVLVVRMVIAGRRAEEGPRVRRIEGTQEELVYQSVQAVESIKGRITNTGDDHVAFETGASFYSWRGQTGTIHISDNDDGSVNVEVVISPRPSIQRYDWHEGARIATKIFGFIESRKPTL